MGMYVKLVLKLENLRKYLVDIKKVFVEDVDVVTMCFKMLLMYFGNIVCDLSEEKYCFIKFFNVVF